LVKIRGGENKSKLGVGGARQKGILLMLVPENQKLVQSKTTNIGHGNGVVVGMKKDGTNQTSGKKLAEVLFPLFIRKKGA